MKKSGLVVVLVCLIIGVSTAGQADSVVSKVDWPAFMRSHDMLFDKLPKGWTQAPHFGNASIGSMLYQAGNTIRLQVFRNDVHDHRDNSHGWAAYSRPRLGIGHFSLNPVGRLQGCKWRKDLWNAELIGTIKTDKGEIKIRHFTHAEDMAIVTELTATEGEQGYSWTWHPIPAVSTRGGKGIFRGNPAGRKEVQGEVSVWIQDFKVGGQYATAWTDMAKGKMRKFIVSIAHTYPESTAAKDAVADINRFLKMDADKWIKSHRAWWHNYYQKSYVDIPDDKLESHYWQTIYRYGCSSRSGRAYIDCPGLWAQGGRWCYTTTDWNIQCAHWATYAANRLEQGEELLNVFHDQREELIKAVRPVEWREDSAYLAIEVSGNDLRGTRDQDMRYYNLMGNLPWSMNNFWSQYRYSMDDDMLREKIYPLMKRSINLYLHMLKEGKDGKLHLPPTYSPETGMSEDCNFDLALLKWGCLTLLKASERLQIKDPLIPRWKKVLERLPDFPADEHGFRLGSNKTSSPSHRHYSHLLMIYPLYLVNIEQEGARDVLERSYERGIKYKGFRAMVQAHMAPIGASLGLGDQVLVGLKEAEADTHPNGMWYNPPCLEASLAIANSIQTMLIQSWTDPAKSESGPIRIFPAIPKAWKDIEFHDLRTEGAFLVSAKLEAGELKWVRIKSLAGEPCKLRALFKQAPKVVGKRRFKLTSEGKNVWHVDLKKNEEVLLKTD